MIDPRNPAFLINDKEAWRMPKGARLRLSWWRWVFWRWVWIKRYRALAKEER